jgi:hypothetical protein
MSNGHGHHQTQRDILGQEAPNQWGSWYGFLPFVSVSHVYNGNLNHLTAFRGRLSYWLDAAPLFFSFWVSDGVTMLDYPYVLEIVQAAT